MNTSELLVVVAKKLKLTKKETQQRADALSEIISDELANDNVVSLLNIGALEVNKRNERVSFHPTTGKKMLIPPKLVVRFKSSTLLKDKVKSMKV